MLIVFIAIPFCTNLSKFRSWSNDRKESQERAYNNHGIKIYDSEYTVIILEIFLSSVCFRNF